MGSSLLLALLAAAATFCAASAPPEVAINAGHLRGKWISSESGRPIAAFEGVPYAQPPVGELRFQSPVPVAPWSGVRDAVQPGSVCLQRNTFIPGTQQEGSEDCLYLNVYAPETVSRTKPLPVMFWIHGGGFSTGAGALYEPDRLLNKDVVMVSLNYRLGALGFLSTGDANLPGNLGMKDQVQALRWVRDNIRSFGGDPESVTIFGESAGAGSVTHLMLSPMAKGLFHKVIAMSGTALSPWGYHDHTYVRMIARKVGAAVGCNSLKDLKQCLMGKTAEEIQATDEALMQWSNHPIVTFSITAEPSGPDAFQDRPPLEALAAGPVTDVPLMLGFTSDEGGIVAISILEDEQLLKDLNERFHELAPVMYMTEHLPQSLNKRAYGNLRKYYFGDKPICKESEEKFIEFISDGFFGYSVLETIKLQKSHAKSPVYFYEFAYEGANSFSEYLGGKKRYGMCHGDDLFAIFPMKNFRKATPTEADLAYGNKVVDLFTTFAATGRPTKDGSWKEVQDGSHAEYARVSASGISMQKDYAPERMKQWANLPVSLGLSSLSIPHDEL